MKVIYITSVPMNRNSREPVGLVKDEYRDCGLLQGAGEQYGIEEPATYVELALTEEQSGALKRAMPRDTLFVS